MRELLLPELHTLPSNHDLRKLPGRRGKIVEGIYRGISLSFRERFASDGLCFGLHLAIPYDFRYGTTSRAAASLHVHNHNDAPADVD